MDDLLNSFGQLGIRTIQKPKKIVRNISFLKDLQNCLPRVVLIEHEIDFDKRFCLNVVSNREAIDAYSSFEYTMTSPMGLKYYIKHIIRVSNAYLLLKYYLKKTHKSDLMEKHYFHGTQGDKLDSICKQNFNWRLKGTTKGTKFGHGISFSPRSDYSKYSLEPFLFNSQIFKDNFENVTSITSDDELNSMFYVKVLQRYCHTSNCITKIPREGYDTTQNVKGTVFVKYDDFEFYPEYILLLD